MAKEKILVVDDEPMIRWTLIEALRGWDFETVESGTVAAGLAASTLGIAFFGIVTLAGNFALRNWHESAVVAEN